MGAEVFDVAVRGMAEKEFDIDKDGWCLYKAYLKVFTPYRNLNSEEQTEKAIALASRLAAIATDEDKAYIQRRLTDDNYDGQPIYDAAGVPTGRAGFPSQELAGAGEEHVKIGGVKRKFIRDADEYLRAIHTPYGPQPLVWGSISLLRPLFIRFRPDIYFDVRVRDATGEADANTGRALVGQETLKYLGPNGERNLSLLMEGPHYNVRIYSSVDEDPLVVDEDNDLIAAALGTLLLGSSAIDAESESGASVYRINKLASSVPRTNGIEMTTIRSPQIPVIPVKTQTPFIPKEPVPALGSEKRIRNLEASIGAVPVSYNRQLNVARTQAKRTLPLTSAEPGIAEKTVRRVGAAIASTAPRPAPSVSDLFPTISIPSFDSIPQPRHRRRHAYRRYVAPPAPIVAPVIPRPARSTEIPAWARQHITQANVAADTKGVAAAVVDDVLAMQNYDRVNVDPEYTVYKADPKTRGLDTSGGDPVHWEELVERYPDRTVMIRDGSGDLHKYRVSNPYRAAAYRRKPTFSFGDPAGLNPQQTVMAQQNLDVLTEIAPDEMIADTKYATALLESLWYCGAGHDIGGDPRCFPARVLGELREFKMYKDEKARAALASRARQYSEWEFIKGVLKKVRGQLTGADRAVGPIDVSGIPEETRVGPNLSATASTAELAGRIAAAGIVEEETVKPPEPPVAPRTTSVSRTAAVRIGDVISVGTGPGSKSKIPKIARVALATPPQTLGAIGLRPLPPPAAFGAWGSRFRPIIPGN